MEYFFSLFLDENKCNHSHCSDNEYVILCLGNGRISVERIESRQPIQLSHVYIIALPHEFEMVSARMAFSCADTNLIIYNSMGSILCYKWKLATENLENMKYIYRKCEIEHQLFVEDNIGNCLSLEEQKQFEFENQRKILVQQRKAEVLEIITKLKNEFAAIKEQNNKLPDKFQLNSTAFKIDKRITDDLELKNKRIFGVIQRELQTKIHKIRTQAERMVHIYLDNLEHWPITITGFR